MASIPTRPSLLLRVRNPKDTAAWQEFTSIYTPVVRAYARRCGVPQQELDDLFQEVLWAVSQLIGKFEHDPVNRRFRPWLWSITHRRILKWRSGLRKAPIQPEDSIILKSATDEDAALEKYWEEQWSKHVLARAMAKTREHFSARTFEVFQRRVVLQQSAEEVARVMGMDVETVYKYKQRVLARLQQEAEALDV